VIDGERWLGWGKTLRFRTKNLKDLEDLAVKQGSATYRIGANDGVWGFCKGYRLRRLAGLGVYGL
jgi:hypothetical protein